MFRSPNHADATSRCENSTWTPPRMYEKSDVAHENLETRSSTLSNRSLSSTIRRLAFFALTTYSGNFSIVNFAPSTVIAHVAARSAARIFSNVSFWLTLSSSSNRHTSRPRSPTSPSYASAARVAHRGSLRIALARASASSLASSPPFAPDRAPLAPIVVVHDESPTGASTPFCNTSYRVDVDVDVIASRRVASSRTRARSLASRRVRLALSRAGCCRRVSGRTDRHDGYAENTNRSSALGIHITSTLLTRRGNRRISRRWTRARARTSASAASEASGARARRRTAPASAPRARISCADHTARVTHDDRRRQSPVTNGRVHRRARARRVASSREICEISPDRRTPADTGSVRANNTRARWTEVRRTSRARTRPRTGHRRCPGGRNASPRASPRARPSRT